MTSSHDFDCKLNRESNFIAGYTIWRTYFPGVFSGLFSIVFAKDARIAESVKANVLIVVLQLIQTVARDDVHTSLLVPIEQKRNGTLFHEVLKSSVSIEKTDSLKSDPLPVSSIGTGLPFIDGNQLLYLVQINFYNNISYISTATSEWRVDILQKLEKFLFLLYDSVWSSSNLNFQLKIEIVKSTVELLLTCGKFLGPHLRAKIFEILLGQIGDSSSTFRSIALYEVRKIRSFESLWDEFSSFVSDNFVCDIEAIQQRSKRISSFLECENDEFLKKLLSRVNGCTKLLNRFPVIISKQILNSLSILSRPCADQLTNAIFVNKEYVFGKFLYSFIILNELYFNKILYRTISQKIPVLK